VNDNFSGKPDPDAKGPSGPFFRLWRLINNPDKPGYEAKNAQIWCGINISHVENYESVQSALLMCIDALQWSRKVRRCWPAYC
jgi:hypothetical protein